MKKNPIPALLFPLLAAWQPLPTADGATPIAVGTAVHGEITARDRINYNDGSRSVVYVLELEAGQAVGIEVTGAPCTRLMVLRDGGRVAGPSRTDCDSGDNESSARLSLLSPETGRYEVAVSGADRRAFGPFRLQTRALRLHDGNAPLQPGASIAGLLRGEARVYRLDIHRTGYYSIDLRSSEFDPSLQLEGKELALEDDDGGGRFDSRLRVVLEPGTYTLRAVSVDGSDGLFELSVSDDNLPAGVRLRNGGTLAADGRPVTGSLAGGGREYALHVARTARVTINLESDDFDAALELHGNGLSLGDDDGGSGTDSRLSAVLDPGDYVVVARGLAEGASGLFRLSATEEPIDVAGLRNGGAIEPGAAVTGLYQGEPRRYQLTVAEAGELVIELASRDFDAVLELHGEDGLVAEDDDGGDASNARITARVEPGTYTIVARGYGEHGCGLFELGVRLRR